MRKLRPYGIYEPPLGLRPVYAVPANEGYHLYDVEYGTRLPLRFVVKPDGRVENWHGEQVSWRIHELNDTKQTVNPQ